MAGLINGLTCGGTCKPDEAENSAHSSAGSISSRRPVSRCRAASSCCCRRWWSDQDLFPTPSSQRVGPANDMGQPSKSDRREHDGLRPRPPRPSRRQTTSRVGPGFGRAGSRAAQSRPPTAPGERVFENPVSISRPGEPGLSGTNAGRQRWIRLTTPRRGTRPCRSGEVGRRTVGCRRAGRRKLGSRQAGRRKLWRRPEAGRATLGSRQAGRRKLGGRQAGRATLGSRPGRPTQTRRPPGRPSHPRQPPGRPRHPRQPGRGPRVSSGRSPDGPAIRCALVDRCPVVGLCITHLGARGQPGVGRTGDDRRHDSGWCGRLRPRG